MTAARTVLLVDDEPALLDSLGPYLKRAGFDVVCATDGPEAVALFNARHPDVVVLDINLPTFPGTEVLRRIRSTSDAAVIMLSARASELDRVLGIELGADDYVTKPFSPRELVARVESVLRRSRHGAPTAPQRIRRIGPIAIDLLGREVRVDDKPIALTPMQFKILDVLASHAGQTLTRAQLLELLGTDSHVTERTLDRHIANLRARLEPGSAEPRYIVTVFGVGYKMVNASPRTESA